jgi:hypothetical protein
MIFSTETLEEKVNNGAKLLDNIRPEWFNEINIDGLDIRCIENCICGQLFMEEAQLLMEGSDDMLWFESGYHYAVENLQINARQNGFCLPEGMSDGDTFNDQAWESLAIVWIEKIEKRRAEAGTML